MRGCVLQPWVFVLKGEHCFHKKLLVLRYLKIKIISMLLCYILLYLQLDFRGLWCGSILFGTLARGPWKVVQLWGPGSMDPCRPYPHHY